MCFVNKKFVHKKWIIIKKEMHQNSEHASKVLKRKRKCQKTHIKGDSDMHPSFYL